jgi:hypothetical protein
MGWTLRLFPSWTHVGEYLVFLAVCIAGIVNESWLWCAHPPISVMPIAQIKRPRSVRVIEAGSSEKFRDGSPVELLHEKLSWPGREVHSLFSSMGYGRCEQKRKWPRTGGAGPSSGA